jgi:hypothetical protein
MVYECIDIELHNKCCMANAFLANLSPSVFKLGSDPWLVLSQLIDLLTVVILSCQCTKIDFCCSNIAWWSSLGTC